MKHSKQIKWALVLCFTIFTVALLAGCAGSPGMTKKDVNRRQYNAIHTDWLMFQDDIDTILLLDRPSRLSPTYSR
jgi:hypothetical protein